MRSRGRPLLSVIVPLHDTAAYVEECIDSLVAQEVDDLEVVLVDDASTDDSLEVAVRAARGRLRGTAFRSYHRGVGGARNAGVRLATGTYLAFLDSDDVALPSGYAKLVAALDESGSSFGTATTLRGPTLAEAEVPRWIAAVHRQRRIAVEPRSYPEITRDILTANKVYRRSFWESSRAMFPERLRYEDQVAISKAYLDAGTVDVLPHPVYFWRERQDGSSITQGRGQLDSLQDRVATKILASRTIETSASDRIVEVWRRYGLLGDLPEYLRQLPQCDDTFWSLLRNWLRLLTDDDVIAGSNLHVMQRMTASLVRAGEREAATALVTRIQDKELELPLELDRGDVLAVLPDGVPAREVPPRRVRRLQQRDVGWRFEVECLDVADGTLSVAGTATVGGFTSVPPLTLTCVLVGCSGGREVDLPVRPLGGQRIAVDIDPALLPEGEQSWRLRFGARLGHLTLQRVPGAWQRVAGSVEGVRVGGAQVEVDAGRRGLVLDLGGRESATSAATPSTPRRRPARGGEQPRGFALRRR
jgi:glycosyltransferase involved in cell wall biosynthesis